MNFRKIIIVLFLSVPVLSSIISAIHLVRFFELGNPTIMSYVLSLVFELGSIASFLVLSILKQTNKTLLWVVFIILALLQIVGNVYFSYDYIFNILQSNPHWLDSIKSFMNFFEIDVKDTHIVLSLIIGLPIPIIALFFLKSTSEYLQEFSFKQHYSNNQVLDEKITISESNIDTNNKNNHFTENDFSSDNDLQFDIPKNNL
jgi:hypothetical protein